MKRLGIFIITLFFCFTGSAVWAQSSQGPREVKATIISIDETTQQGSAQSFVLTARTKENEEFHIDTNISHPSGLYFSLKPGDQVKLREAEMSDGTMQTFFDDKIRTQSLYLLFFLFAIFTILISSFRGFFSLVGVGITMVVLGVFLLPSIIAGKDPILYTVMASVMILFVNIHLSHGFRIRTFFAFLGTVSGLIIVWILSVLFTNFSSLSGVGTEEAGMLMGQIDAIKDPVLIFIAATILGAVGVLDDVAVSQAEIVEELKQANPSLTRKDLFVRAMRIGQHHIASTVNTLVLVYAGAALPTFLLFFSTSHDLASFLNYEVVAEEMVRTLAGTMALILTVPLSTLFATIPQIDNKEKQG